jgi:sortase A
VTRRHLLRLTLALPLLTACGGGAAPTPPSPTRVYFEVPTPTPVPPGYACPTPVPASGAARGAGASGAPGTPGTPGMPGTPGVSGTPGTPATAAGTAVATRTGSPVSGQPTGVASPAAAGSPAATGTLNPTLPLDPGQRASAQVFQPPPVRATPIPARRPAPTALIIPTIRLDARIVRIGTRLDQKGSLVWETAAFAVGHHEGSANPGEPGNVVLSGHISSVREGNIFNQLPRVQVGEGIIVRSPERDYLYAVDTIKTVLPTEIHVLEPTEREQAILITCVPDRVYTHRLIVTAVRV